MKRCKFIKTIIHPEDKLIEWAPKGWETFGIKKRLAWVDNNISKHKSVLAISKLNLIDILHRYLDIRAEIASRIGR